MTEKDIDGLCGHVKNLPFGQLLAVCREVSGTLPKVHSQDGMVASIATWLRASPTPQERLYHAARLYSRLASLDVLKPWTLYRLGMTWGKAARFTFFDILSKSMDSDGFFYTCGYTENDFLLCCAILMSDGGIMTMEHRLVCFCLWIEHPFVAVYDAGALVVHAKRLRAGLAAVSVDPEKCLHGYYEKLSSAIEEVAKTVLA